MTAVNLREVQKEIWSIPKSSFLPADQDLFLRTVLCERISNLSETEILPLHDVCVWLAAYAKPPQYALDYAADNTKEQTTALNLLTDAWKHHFRHLTEIGIIQGKKETTNDSNS